MPSNFSTLLGVCVHVCTLGPPISGAKVKIIGPAEVKNDR